MIREQRGLSCYLRSFPFPVGRSFKCEQVSSCSEEGRILPRENFAGVMTRSLASGILAVEVTGLCPWGSSPTPYLRLWERELIRYLAQMGMGAPFHPQRSAQPSCCTGHWSVSMGLRQGGTARPHHIRSLSITSWRGS